MTRPPGVATVISSSTRRLSNALAMGESDGIANADELMSIWTSVSALELARERLPGDAWEKILNSPALVISARIQHHLQQLGATRVERAGSPGNTELLQSILRLGGRQNIT